ncbi:MAG: serine O-acetyltransferase [Bacteroidales bacterium]
MRIFRLLFQKKSSDFPTKKQITGFLKKVVALMYPVLSDTSAGFCSAREVRKSLVRLLSVIEENFPGGPDVLAGNFIDTLPEIKKQLDADADFIMEGDPAATSVDEVIITYPGFYAILVYRLANKLALLGVPLIPRIMTEYAHSLTGIDIHPKAAIDSPFFIDHGTGIVIGETSIIGRRVKLYQGVTIGALSVKKEMANRKRHPTIEDDVVIYAGSTILGGETVIGHDSIIGGNVWLTSSVPPYSLVYHENIIKVRERNSNSGKKTD